MKTVSVRITTEQTKRLQDVLPYIPGKNSLNTLTQRGVDLFLRQEGDLYEAAYKGVQEKLNKK